MPVYRLSEHLAFPPPHLATEDGLLAVGGDLSPDRLLLAYENGIFPWYNAGDPILWWSPDPRVVLPIDGFHVSRSLRKILRQKRFDITFDRDFARVIEACATIHRPTQRGTWITREMQRAYTTMHELGYAHSVECWQEEKLAGGIYGVSLGTCFFGESMFSAVPNASKVALATLVENLGAWGFTLFDCQVPNRHLGSLGAQEIPRTTFLRLLKQGLHADAPPGAWPNTV